jgi:hypothetical protein
VEQAEKWWDVVRLGRRELETERRLNKSRGWGDITACEYLVRCFGWA